jgi:hypothetical protein
VNEDLAPNAKLVTPLHPHPVSEKSDVVRRDKAPLHPRHGEAISTSVTTRMKSPSAVVKGSARNGVSFTRIATDQIDDDLEFCDIDVLAKTALGKRNRLPKSMYEKEQQHTTGEQPGEENMDATRPSRKQVGAASLCCTLLNFQLIRKRPSKKKRLFRRLDHPR